jgi:hypothetical protein
MRSISIRRVVAAGAIVLAFIPTVHSQRPVEPAASASSAAVRPADSSAVVPFKIQVPDAVLTDLKRRVKEVRYPDELRKERQTSAPHAATRPSAGGRHLE